MNKDIFLSNSLGNKKERFIPINKNKVGMYVCGPTVYDDSHIGNARPLVVFDILFRVLKCKFGDKTVTYVRNITDIDDKIIQSSNEKHISTEELTNKITKNFHDDCAYLNCENPNFEPKATENISSMIEMINQLLRNGYAYFNNQHVYFEVRKFKDYGKLSNKNLEELITVSRVEVSKNKKNPEDFVLWKPSKDNEPFWESPWGKGRPGWHLECSVMSEKFLGKKFDIHGGGLDLVFPHHENEIAQSRCVNNTNNFANYWVHNGYVTFDKEKMSKSIGNIVTVKKLRETINGQVVRLALLSSHYRQPLDWSEKLINESKNTLDKWYSQFEEMESEELPDDVLSPLLEDLNTPEYISKLHSLYDKASKGNKSSKVRFLSACKLIGLFGENVKSWKNFKKQRAKVDEGFIHQKIIDRNNARKKGDYKLADTLRKELETNGVIIEDKQDKTTWKYK